MGDRRAAPPPPAPPACAARAQPLARRLGLPRSGPTLSSPPPSLSSPPFPGLTFCFSRPVCSPSCFRCPSPPCLSFHAFCPALPSPVSLPPACSISASYRFSSWFTSLLPHPTSPPLGLRLCTPLSSCLCPPTSPPCHWSFLVSDSPISSAFASSCLSLNPVSPATFPSCPFLSFHHLLNDRFPPCPAILPA